ncbi:hypothetical protein FV219_05315 [Methylobacterium sp. WL122]|nr:hypothetical protein FV219_05315 [Methylobacterium sp. WL122]
MFTLLVTSLAANAASLTGEEALTKSASLPKESIGLMQQISETVDDPKTEEANQKRKFFPIGYKCPKSPGNGLLETIKKNENGVIYRGRFYVANRLVYRITLETAMPGEKFEILKDLTLTSSLTEENREFARKSLKTIDPLREVVCEGPPDEKVRYENILEVNKKSLEVLENINKQ